MQKKVTQSCYQNRTILTKLDSLPLYHLAAGGGSNPSLDPSVCSSNVLAFSH